VCLIDQNSVNGTFVNKQKITPDQPVPLKDADELRFGRMVLNYYTS
jgi:pSer/pThr/pTyr-binding forkhead associated (FHA) protein